MEGLVQNNTKNHLAKILHAKSYLETKQKAF